MKFKKIFIMLVLILWSLVILLSSVNAVDLEVSISAANQDAIERQDNTNFNTDPAAGVSVPILVGRSGGAGNYYWYSGFVFKEIAIPAGANITSAVLEWQSFNSKSVGAMTVPIYLNDVDNASDFSVDADITNRALTTNFTNYAPPTSVTANTRYNTSDFAATVQEVIDRAGWASGNDLMVMLRTSSATAGQDLDAYYYEDDSAKTVKLYITYSGGGGGGSNNTITTNISSPYNSSNIGVQVNTTQNSNTSYILDFLRGDERAYYPLDINFTDMSNNSYDGTNNGANLRPGKIGYGANFSGAEYVDLNANIIDVADPFTVSLWFNTQAQGANMVFIGDGQTSGGDWIYYINTDNEIFFFSRDDSGTFANLNYPTWANNTWVHTAVVRENSSLIKLYVNGVLVDSNTNSVGAFTNPHDVTIGAGNDGTSRFFNGSLDDVRLYSQALNSSEINDIYSKTLTSICNNCTVGNTTLSSVSEGSHNISLYAYSSNLSVLLQSFSVDLTPPSLNVTNNSESSSYNVDFSNIINYTSGDTCNVTTDQAETFSCDNTSYDFSTNGNHTFNVTVTDAAGNSNNSFNNFVLINPFVRFNFQTPNGTAITSYTLNGTSFTSTASFKVYDLVSSVPENATLLFEKAGYESTNITVLLTSTSSFNNTYNISLAKIVVKIYDRESLLLLTNRTVTLTLIDTIGDNGTTTTGLYNFTKLNFVSGDYHIIAETSGYETEVNYFTFTNQEITTVLFYMLNSTTVDQGTITLIVKDDFSKFVDGALCKAKEWRTSDNAYVSVSEGETNSNGEVILNIELGTKEYVFTCSKLGYSKTTEPEIIKVDLSERTIVLSETQSSEVVSLAGFTYQLTPYKDTFINSSHAKISFNYTDTNSEVTQGCIAFYNTDPLIDILLTSNCVIGDSNNIELSYPINNSFGLRADVYVIKGAGSKVAIASYNYDSNINLTEMLERYNFDIIFLAVLVMLAIGLGIAAQNIYISLISISIVSWLAYAIIPLIVSGGVAMTITVMCIIIMWGIYRNK